MQLGRNNSMIGRYIDIGAWRSSTEAIFFDMK